MTKQKLTVHMVRKCEIHGLNEHQSLELINNSMSYNISRSTYPNYKKKLYEDEKFLSLKKSIYKSKFLKSLMSYMDNDIDD